MDVAIHSVAIVIIVLFPLLAVADARSAFDADATTDFITARLAQIDEKADDPHRLLLGVVYAAEAGGARQARPYLEHAFALAPEDPVVLIHLDKYCRRTYADWALCRDNDWPAALAALVPENGAPWLRIAARAAERGDEPARRDALFEAAERPYYDGYFGLNAYRMYQALHRLAPSGRSLHSETVAIFAMGIAAAGINHEVDLIRGCREATEVRLAHLCRRVANQMVDHARTMVGVSAAMSYLAGLPTLTDGERTRLDRNRSALERLARYIDTEPGLWATGASAEQSMQVLATAGEWQMWLRLAADR